MRYTSPPSDLFKRNREKFARQLPPGQMAILFSSNLVTRSADFNYPFAQDKNFYYLTGLDQEDLVLVLFPDAPRHDWQEILFVPDYSQKMVTVEGEKLQRKEARAISGVASVRDAGQWKLALSAFLSYAEGVCIDGNEHEFRRWSRNTPAHQLAQWIRDEYPGYPLHRAAPIFRRIRMRKEAEELLQIRVACSITGKAFERVARFARPGVWEFELEAEIVHEFIRNRATGPAFPPIVASGKNSCTLHYIRNESQCQPGDIIQLDLGAEYGHYNGDLSRVIPVSGTFDARQREVYEAVLRVLRGSIAHIRPGITLQELHLNTAQMMQEELLRLGLLDAEQVKKEKDQPVSYRKYFMHPVSHHLGLDTHDLADRFAPLAPGMVLTVEPGIYIPEEGMGMRLENDVLVTEDGVEDLTAGIPLEVEEIEELMN